MGRMVATKVNVRAVGIGAVLPSIGWVGCNDGGTALECYVWGLSPVALFRLFRWMCLWKQLHMERVTP